MTHYYFSDCLYYTPMLSDPYIGKMQMRTITNIRTGQIVPNMYAGKTLSPLSIPAPASVIPTAQAAVTVFRRLLQRAKRWTR